MRITYLHQYFNTPEMSGSTRSFEIAKKLVQCGHTVTVITQSNRLNKKKWTQTNEYGINVIWFSSNYSNKLGFFERVLIFLKFSVYATIKASQIPSDLVFASSTPLTIVIPGYISSKIQSANFVLEIRDLWPEIPIAMGYLNNPILKYLAKRLEVFAYKKSDLIIALSIDMKNGILKHGISDDKIIVITNFSDTQQFKKDIDARYRINQKYGFGSDTIICLYAGTFGHVNGVDYLVHIASHLIEMQTVKFFLVGDGKEFKNVQKLALEKDCLNKNIFLFPPVSKTEIIELFSISDVAISTVIDIKELEANSANKFFDGLAAGCCMMINHGGWQSSFIIENKCGIVLNHDIKSSSEKLKNLFADKNQILNFGSCARLASNKFEKNAQIDYLIEQISQLTKK